MLGCSDVVAFVAASLLVVVIILLKRKPVRLLLASILILVIIILSYNGYYIRGTPRALVVAYTSAQSSTGFKM